jgi:hypothetical protein
LLLVVLLLAAGCQAEPSMLVHRVLASPDREVHRLVHLPGVATPSVRRQLRERGIQLLSRRGDGWWLAHGPPGAFEDQVGDRAPVSQPARDKLSARLLRRLAGAGPGDEVEVEVLLSPVSDPQGPLAAVAGTTPRRAGFAPLYRLSLAAGRVIEVAALDPVRRVDLPPGPAVPLLDQSREAIGVEPLHAIDTSTSPPTYALGGKGTVGGVWDPSGVEPTHGDLKDNLIRHPKTSIPTSLSHGTAVSGCMAGTGARSAAPPDHPWEPYQLRGMAPEAKIAAYLTTNDEDDSGTPTTFLEQYLEARNTYGVDVLSFSFSHTLHATYDSTGANLDFVIHRSSASLPAPVPIAIASGNEAWKYGYGSVTGMGSAKNVLTVGASDWTNGALVSFSSFGPTLDGRIKPEVVAPGCAAHGGTQVGLDRVRLVPKAGSGAPVKEWTFDADAQGWGVVRHLTAPKVQAGVLQATTTGDDPGLRSPDKLGLDTALYGAVEITMRVDRHHRAELYWKTDKTDFHDKRSERFFVSADGQLHTYSVSLAGHKEWKDTLEQLRIDPITTGIALPAPGDTYSTNCGTSMSTPIVAGAVLLLVQAWREALAGEPDPPPAMLKALLVATARDMVGKGPGGNPDLKGAPTPYAAGPDFPTGYGEIQVDRAVELIRQAGKGRRGLVTGSVLYTGRRVQLRMRLSAPTVPINVTLAWDDPPGEPGAKAALQNDLDLRVKTPAGEELLPWVLDPASPTAAATTGVDRRNNLEQVAIPAAKGDHVIAVSGHELARGPQPFALVLSDVSALDDLALDGDGDGAFADTDCDDADPGVHPDAEEVPGNGKDDDCDPKTPDAPPAGGDRSSRHDGGDLGADGGDLEPGGGGGCSCHTHGHRQENQLLSLVSFFCILGLLIYFRRA